MCLGAYLGAEADGSFWLALGLTFAAQRMLPWRVFTLLCVRFGAPVLVAAVSQGVLRRPPSAESTVIGKAATVAQLAVFSAPLLSRRPAPALAVQRGFRLLQGITAALLLVTPPAPGTPEAAAAREARP